MAKYPPLFNRVPMRTNNRKPQEIQREFENFWHKVSRMVGKNPEKTTGMRKLQEACMWLTRAAAIADFDGEPGEPGINELIDNKIKEFKEKQKDIEEELDKKSSGVEIIYKPSRTIPQTNEPD